MIRRLLCAKTYNRLLTVQRRIERRMSVHQIHEAKNYLRFLQENPHELDILFRELLIGVTSFFRDADAFAVLTDVALPKLVQGKPDGYTIRVWSAGCSTGEEAYSLAIVVQEAIDRFNPALQLQVFATDLDTRAVEIARRGVYPEGIAVDVSKERLQQFFSHEDGHYKIQKHLRERLIFVPQDIISDPPFTKLDLLVCRNVLIYLDAEIQTKLFPVFHLAIKPGGLLFLGNSESICHFTGAFEPIDKKQKIFERKDTLISPPLLRDSFALNLPRDIIETLVANQPVERSADANLLHLLERRLLRCYTPPTVITSDRGEIVYIHGRTGAFLEPAEGQPSNNILTMARLGLQPTLSALLRRAAAGRSEVVQQGVHVINDGNSITVDIVVRAISEPEAVRGLMMITFEETRSDTTKQVQAPVATKKKKKSSGHDAELEQQLQYTRESLQNTIEELENTNEELKSSNEELQMKMEDLALVNDDLTNLLNNTCIATIFLDDDLNIKRFTQAVSDIIKIIATDVGRPIGDLVTSLDYDLVTDARKVLRTLMTKESEVESTDGRWFRVRLMPYRTSENVINGLVATFVDELCGQMLAYSGKGNFDKSVFDLAATVRGMGDLLDSSVPKRNVSLQYEFAADLPGVEGDVTSIRQIVMNLIPNASEAIGIDDGKILVRTGRVSVSEDDLAGKHLDDDLHSGDYVYLDVVDTGCGIDDGSIEKIFDPFFTTKFAGRRLGLACVQGIVRSHHGAIIIESRLRHGNTVRVLPASGVGQTDHNARPASVGAGLFHGAADSAGC